MKTKKLLLTAMLMLSATTCQATGIVSAAASVAVITAVPCGYYLYKSDGDVQKAKRLFRKDKNAAVTSVIAAIHEKCHSDECKTIERCLEELKSTPSQLAEDKFAEAIEVAQQTKTYKDAKNIVKDGYDSVKDAVDKFGKPKK